MPSVKNKVNLQSLITIEELEQLKDIRVEQLPEQIGKIGEGTFGEVFLFKAEDGSDRAGKKPKINLFNKSKEEENTIKEHLKKVLGEIKILHQLEHERIIKIFEFYLDQDQIIIFMEAMEGSVKDVIKEKGPLLETEAMEFFTQAAEGLVYLHSRKPRAIIHRDIKCENLLLTVEKNVKLADFGLAIDLAIGSGSVSVSPTAPTSFAGTYYFIAPEVIGKMQQPEAYGRKSDVWSLACTLVEMISGEPPYRRINFIEFIKRASPDSQNPLLYSGDLLLPAASITIKALLNSLFIADSKLRPSSDGALKLAYGVTQQAAEQGDADGQCNLGLIADFNAVIDQESKTGLMNDLGGGVGAYWKQWTIRNIGAANWRDVKLFSTDVSSDKLKPFAPAVTVPALEPGQRTDLLIWMYGPVFEPGVYRGHWRLRTAQGVEFGPELLFDFTIGDQEINI